MLAFTLRILSGTILTKRKEGITKGTKRRTKQNLIKKKKCEKRSSKQLQSDKSTKDFKLKRKIQTATHYAQL